MKTLILSCNTGAGHNSSANGIKEYLTTLNESCNVVDALSFISKKFSLFISNAHAVIYKRFPKFNAFAYDYVLKHESKFTDKFLGYKLLEKGSENLKNYIKNGGYNVVICTHVFSAYMLTCAIKKYKLKLKTAFVCTDYSFTPSLQRNNFDFYFIPHPNLINEFIKNGIPTNKIIASGIPVKSVFYSSLNKTEAKQNLSLPNNVKHLVIALGSMGCGPIKKLVKGFIKLNSNIIVTVVCGNNVKTQKYLQKVFKNNSNLHVLGYVNNMSLLLDSADLYLTKPGGLSVTEGLLKNVKMVLYNTVSGCEKGNVKFMEDKGYALSVNKVKDAICLCDKLLLENSKTINYFKEDNFNLKNSSKVIYDTLK